VQATERATTIAKNPRGKTKGKKFAERKSQEVSTKGSERKNGSKEADLSTVAAQAQARVQAAADAVAGEVVTDAPAAVGKECSTKEASVATAESSQDGAKDRKEEASSSNKA
jgi:hypothetical protein